MSLNETLGTSYALVFPGQGSQYVGMAKDLAASSDIALWSAAHLALANTYESGLTSAVVGDREWTASDHGWQPAATPAPPGTATLTLG